MERGGWFQYPCSTEDEAAANLLTNSALDPQSKIPEYKYCAVRFDPKKSAVPQK